MIDADDIELVTPDEDDAGVADAVVAWMLELVDPEDVDDAGESGGGSGR